MRASRPMRRPPQKSRAQPYPRDFLETAKGACFARRDGIVLGKASQRTDPGGAEFAMSKNFTACLFLTNTFTRSR